VLLAIVVTSLLVVVLLRPRERGGWGTPADGCRQPSS